MFQLAATATPHTTTHSHHSVPGWVFLALLAWAAGYLFICWIRPFRHCHRCKGLGRRPARIGRGYRPCNPCDSTGYRIRAGRHLLKYLRDIRRAGTPRNGNHR